MNVKQVLECERDRLRRFQLLPHRYRKVGIGLFIISLLSLVILAVGFDNVEVWKDVSRKVMLVALLLISVSKDQVEDELTMKLRAQSYSMAFIAAVIFTLVQPYINFGVAALVEPEEAAFAELDIFVILWFMLVIQICFYQLLKKTR